MSIQLVLLLSFSGIYCVHSAYFCGQYPYQYYSDFPCQPTTFLQPGSRCQNGGTFLGWSCMQSQQCQFSTPSGVLTGQCVSGNCCTNFQDSSSTQCPSNMIRQNRFCDSDSQCDSTSSNGRQKRLKGRCLSGQCCVPEPRQSRNPEQCYSTERQLNRRCSRANPCQRTSYWITVVCRGGYCCERDLRQDDDQSCGGGTTVAQSCNYDQDCSYLVRGPNQRATCNRGRRQCCLEQNINDPCSSIGRTWSGRSCNSNTFCFNDQQCFNGYCCQ